MVFSSGELQEHITLQPPHNYLCIFSVTSIRQIALSLLEGLGEISFRALLSGPWQKCMDMSGCISSCAWGEGPLVGDKSQAQGVWDLSDQARVIRSSLKSSLYFPHWTTLITEITLESYNLGERTDIAAKPSFEGLLSSSPLSCLFQDNFSIPFFPHWMITLLGL